MPQKKALYFIVIFVVFLMSEGRRGVGLVEAQKCVKFNSTSAAIICENYVTYDYYLPPGPTDWIIESLVSSNVNKGTLQATLLPSECEAKLLAFICASGYPKCDDSEDTPVGRPLCSSVCEDVHRECAETFAASGTALPDCSALPNSSSLVETSKGTKVKVQCFQVKNDIPIPEFPFECGGVLGYQAGNEPFPCALQCPYPIYNEGIIEAVTWYIRFIVPITGLLLTLFFLLQCYQYKYWFSFPRQYLVYNTGFIIITHIAFLVPALNGGYHVAGCVTDTQPARNDVGICNFTNWCLYVGSWGNQICFAIISTNILIVVLKKMNPSIRNLLNFWYHFWIFVPPIVILIVTESLGMTGFGTGFAPCWFKPDVEMAGLGDNSLRILLTIIPFTGMLVWGYFSLSVAFYLLFRTGGMHALLKQTRLLCFLIFYGTSQVLGMIILYESMIWGTKPTEKYLTCEVTNWVSSLFNGSQVHCEKGIKVQGDPFAVLWNEALSPTVFGALVLIFFSLDSIKVFRGDNSSSSSKITGLKGSHGSGSTSISFNSSKGAEVPTVNSSRSSD